MACVSFLLAVQDSLEGSLGALRSSKSVKDLIAAWEGLHEAPSATAASVATPVGRGPSTMASSPDPGPTTHALLAGILKLVEQQRAPLPSSPAASQRGIIPPPASPGSRVAKRSSPSLQSPSSFSSSPASSHSRRADRSPGKKQKKEAPALTLLRSHSDLMRAKKEERAAKKALQGTVPDKGNQKPREVKSTPTAAAASASGSGTDSGAATKHTPGEGGKGKEKGKVMGMVALFNKQGRQGKKGSERGRQKSRKLRSSSSSSSIPAIAEEEEEHSPSAISRATVLDVAETDAMLAGSIDRHVVEEGDTEDEGPLKGRTAGTSRARRDGSRSRGQGAGNALPRAASIDSYSDWDESISYTMSATSLSGLLPEGGEDDAVATGTLTTEESKAVAANAAAAASTTTPPPSTAPAAPGLSTAGRHTRQTSDQSFSFDASLEEPMSPGSDSISMSSVRRKLTEAVRRASSDDEDSGAAQGATAAATEPAAATEEAEGPRTWRDIKRRQAVEVAASALLGPRVASKEGSSGAAVTKEAEGGLEEDEAGQGVVSAESSLVSDEGFGITPQHSPARAPAPAIPIPEVEEEEEDEAEDEEEKDEEAQPRSVKTSAKPESDTAPRQSTGVRSKTSAQEPPRFELESKEAPSSMAQDSDWDESMSMSMSMSFSGNDMQRLPASPSSDSSFSPRHTGGPTAAAAATAAVSPPEPKERPKAGKAAVGPTPAVATAGGTEESKASTEGSKASKKGGAMVGHSKKEAPMARPSRGPDTPSASAAEDSDWDESMASMSASFAHSPATSTGRVRGDARHLGTEESKATTKPTSESGKHAAKQRESKPAGLSLGRIASPSSSPSPSPSPSPGTDDTGGEGGDEVSVSSSALGFLDHSSAQVGEEKPPSPASSELTPLSFSEEGLDESDTGELDRQEQGSMRAKPRGIPAKAMQSSLTSEDSSVDLDTLWDKYDKKQTPPSRGLGEGRLTAGGGHGKPGTTGLSRIQEGNEGSNEGSARTPAKTSAAATSAEPQLGATVSNKAPRARAAEASHRHGNNHWGPAGANSDSLDASGLSVPSIHSSPGAPETPPKGLSKRRLPSLLTQALGIESSMDSAPSPVLTPSPPMQPSAVKTALPPGLEGARLGIINLKDSDLEVLRGMQDISDAVAVLAGAICMLMQRPPGWKEAVRLLKEPDFPARAKAVRPSDVEVRGSRFVVMSPVPHA